MEPFTSNNIRISCSLMISWFQSTISTQQSRLFVGIVALIIYFVFLLPIIFYSSLRQTSLQWVYAFLITNILLLCRFFFIYIIHSTSVECTENKIWPMVLCYFETISDNYLNILVGYILLALNIGRYMQIAYRRNVYTTDRRLLIIIHVGMYLTPSLLFFLQYQTGWARLEQFSDGTCDVLYTNVHIQVFNIVIGFVLPIFLNILVIYLGVRHVHLTATLRRAQHHVSAREKYPRSLVIQFLVFYSIWMVFWSPNVIVDQLTNGENGLTNVVKLLCFIGTALDPIIVGALDVRFWKIWRKIWIHLKRQYFKNLQGRVEHVSGVPIPQSGTNPNAEVL